jgi:Glyoxalase-like domain
MADTLQAGVDWCERTLGVSPGPGGQHPLMGTHNRLLRIDSAHWPGAYLEIIAIEPGAPALREPPLRRWFDMDDPTLMTAVHTQGPRLVHWVARTASLEQALEATHQAGWDRGERLKASRMTPQGLLAWEISVRPDGQRLLGGVLPTLIEWGPVHPTEAMATSGVRLRQLRLQHPEHHRLATWAHTVGLQQVCWQDGPACLEASLETPRGTVHLSSAVGSPA